MLYALVTNALACFGPVPAACAPSSALSSVSCALFEYLLPVVPCDCTKRRGAASPMVAGSGRHRKLDAPCVSCGARGSWFERKPTASALIAPPARLCYLSWRRQRPRLHKSAFPVSRTCFRHWCCHIQLCVCQVFLKPRAVAHALGRWRG